MFVTRSIDRVVTPDSTEPDGPPEERGPSVAALPDRRDDILDAVTFAAERFMAGDPIDVALPEVLRHIGTASGAGRVVLVERVRGDDGSHMRLRAEWDARGVLPLAVSDDPRGVPYFPRWERELSAGHLVAGHLRDMPVEERVLLEADGVGSIVVTPITAGGEWWGHVGYDDSHQERDWTAPELDALRAAAGIIGAAVHQAAVTEALERRNGILEAVAAAAPLLVATDRVEEGLSQLLESMRAAVAARSAWAFRIDRDNVGHLVTERVAPDALPATAFSDSVPLTEAGAAQLLAAGRAQSYDIFVDPEGAREAMRRLGARSWVIVPIAVEGSLRGAIGLDSVEDRPWTDGEVIALQVAAAAVAAAVLRQATEERLRQIAKMEAVGRVAGSLAHDFGNLLTVVKGRSELLLQEPLDVQSREDVQAILDASDRGADLVHDLLSFSHRRAGRIQPVDLSEQVRRAERMLARTVGSGITIEIEHDPSIPRVLADPGELEHVLVNLIVNARDAMPDGGTIRIVTGTAASPTGAMVTLAVVDTGTGMDEATRARVFEPFFSTKPEGVGTGLGLPTAYASITAWGGTIDVATEPSVGSTFTLRLRPAADS